MRVVICFILLSFFLNSSTFAHPGRTDSNGGHVCRTNCEQYGLDYGQYHYHNSTPTYRRPSSGESDSSNGDGWVTLIIIGGFIVLYIIGSFDSKKTKPIKTNTRIDVTPRPELLKSDADIIDLLPSETEVVLEGFLIETVYRKMPFFVVRFVDENVQEHKLVGNYSLPLYKNKKYHVEGTITYDRRYGKQITVKVIELIKKH